MSGFSFRLVRNEPGEVCFELRGDVRRGGPALRATARRGGAARTAT